MKISLLLLLTVVLAVGCKKSTNNSTGGTDPGDTDTGTIAVTAIGTPVGGPVSKSIGPAGGDITSTDGRVHLIIPAGALAASTNISIQPVTNECPGGLGVAYDLLPNGTKFAVPATLVFNYADSDVEGTDPYLFYIGFQDSLRQWEIDTENKEVDTAARTVSLDISHFTVYAIEAQLRILCSANQLKSGQQADLAIIREVTTTTGNNNGSISVQSTIQKVPDGYLSDWAVNDVVGGSSKDGTIVKGGIASHARYTAPAAIDKDRYITTSITHNTPITVRLGKGKIITLVNKKFTKKIKLLSGNYNFDLQVLYQWQGGSGVYDDVYTDGATFQVEVKNWKVTDVAFQNEDPEESPTSGSNSETKATWIPGGSPGMINIAQAYGVVLDSAGHLSVLVTVVNLGTESPKWDMEPLDKSGDYFAGGDPETSPLQILYFDLTSDPQPPVVLAQYYNASLVLYVTPKN